MHSGSGSGSVVSNRRIQCIASVFRWVIVAAAAAAGIEIFFSVIFFCLFYFLQQHYHIIVYIRVHCYQDDYYHCYHIVSILHRIFTVCLLAAYIVIDYSTELRRYSFSLGVRVRHLHNKQNIGRCNPCDFSPMLTQVFERYSHRSFGLCVAS